MRWILNSINQFYLFKLDTFYPRFMRKTTLIIEQANYCKSMTYSCPTGFLQTWSGGDHPPCSSPYKQEPCWCSCRRWRASSRPAIGWWGCLRRTRSECRWELCRASSHDTSCRTSSASTGRSRRKCPAWVWRVRSSLRTTTSYLNANRWSSRAERPPKFLRVWIHPTR